MRFDALVANAGRLRILTSLALADGQEFVQLRRTTELSDGNLASHAKRLEGAGLIAIRKEFRAGKPVTHFALTASGRMALEEHARQLLAAIGAARTDADAPRSPGVVVTQSPAAEEDWVD